MKRHDMIDFQPTRFPAQSTRQPSRSRTRRRTLCQRLLIQLERERETRLKRRHPVLRTPLRSCLDGPARSLGYGKDSSVPGAASRDSQRTLSGKSGPIPSGGQVNRLARYRRAGLSSARPAAAQSGSGRVFLPGWASGAVRVRRFWGILAAFSLGGRFLHRSGNTARNISPNRPALTSEPWPSMQPRHPTHAPLLPSRT